MFAQFNKDQALLKGSVRELLRKGILSSTPNVGEALIPQKLEQLITNTVVRLSPEFALLTNEYDPQKKHEFNRVTALGNIIGLTGAQGETAVTPSDNSTYIRDFVNLKVIRRKGAVTNFEQDASAKYIDALAVEMENQLRAQIYGLNYYIIHGNGDANQYEFSGWDRFITTNRRNDGFNAGIPSIPSSTATLDSMIDSNISFGGILHRKAFVMSPQMLSKFSQLITNVRLNQGMEGMGKVEIEGGWRLNAYRDIPIVASTYLSGARAVTMGTVTAATAATGGALSDGTYFFRVAAITPEGESMASAQVSITISAGTATQTITLSFTAITNAGSYKVYGATTTGGLSNTKLIDWVAAATYDSAGTITGAAASIVLTTMTPSTVRISASHVNDLPLTASGGVNSEVIMLVDLDRIQGLGKFAYTNSGGRANGVVSVEQLAKTDDYVPFLIKTYGAIVPSFEATSVISRGWRVA